MRCRVMAVVCAVLFAAASAAGASGDSASFEAPLAVSFSDLSKISALLAAPSSKKIVMTSILKREYTDEAYQCRAEWQGADGSRQSYEGRPSRDRYSAEDDAIFRCRDANWNNRDNGQCRPLDCRRR